MEKKQEYTLFLIKLPKDLHKQLKIASAIRGKDMTKIIVDCVRDELEISEITKEY